MDEDLKEVAGAVVAAKVLGDLLLVTLVRRNVLTFEEGCALIGETHAAIESRKGNPRDDDEILAHAQRMLQGSLRTLAGSAGPPTKGRA